MRRLIHAMLAFIMAALLHPTAITSQENSNWLFNLSEGLGAAPTNFQDYYPEIAASGNEVHTIWFTQTATAKELNYRRSSDNGASWSSKVKLYEGDLDWNSTFNRMAVSGNYVHIVLSWYSGTDRELLYFRSKDGGASFEPPKVIYTTTVDLLNVHIAAQGSNIGVSFTDECWFCGIKKTLMLLKSEDNGSSFATIPVLDDAAGNLSDFANIAVSGQHVYLLYLKSIGYWANYDFELHLLCSNDGGSSFSDKTISVPANSGIHHAFQPLSSSNGYCPKIAADGNKVWVVWSGWDENNLATVFVNYSADAGANITTALKVSGDVHTMHSGLETIVAKGDNVYVVFNTNDYKLFVNYSSGGGAWLAEPIEFTQPNALIINGGIEPQLAIDPLDNGAFLLASNFVFGKISPQGQVSGPSFYSSLSFTVGRRPKLAVSNGYVHLVMEGGVEWLTTGAWTDNEIWYRRVTLNQNDPGQVDQALEMELIPNPGDLSGISRFDNMIIDSRVADGFTDAMTVEMWIKPAAVAYEKKILTQLHANTWNMYNPLSFQLWASATQQPVAGIYTSTGAYAIGGQRNMVSDHWNHVAVTYENNGSPDNFKLLLNGQVIASTTATGSIAASKALWFLGSFSDNYVTDGFNGSIDEMRFWNVARTAAELLDNRFTSLSGNEPGLAAYYNFNAVSPFGEVTDITGKGNTGHLMYQEASVPAGITDLGARFSYTQTVATFAFSQHSNGGETFQWDFGNGQQSSLVNPAVTYSTPGNYDVCLDVFGNGMYDTYCETVTVQGIEKVIPTEGGNTDYVTLYVYGGGFNANNVVKLRRSGFSDIVAEQTIFDAKKTLTGLLNLDGQATGVWDLVIANGGQEMVLPAAFSIVPGEVAAPYVHYNGGGTILINRWTPQTITLGNSANVDAHGVLLWVSIPNDAGNDIAFLNLNVQAPQLAIDNGWEDDLKSLGYYIEVDSLFGKPSNSRVYPFYFPILPAKSSINIMLRVKVGQSSNKVPVNAWLSGPFYHSPLSAAVQGCVGLSIVKACVKGAIGFIPALPCLSGALSVVSSYTDIPPPTPSALEHIDTRSWYWIIGTNLLECGVSLIPGSNVYAGVLSIITSGVESTQENADCYNGFRQIGWLDILYYPVWSLDPNVKNGAQGYTSNGYIGPQSRMGYQIQFENKNSATAPAHEVTITDTLTFPKIDLSNFAFGPFGWGDSVFYPLPDAKSFGMDIDLRPGKNLIVRVTGELDEAAKTLTWRFVSLDPATMDLVYDPFGGFLPPNLLPPEGEGFVTFSTGVSSNIVNGDVVKNRASIVFDANAPILTNLHKNTFDLLAPESELSAQAPTTTDTLIQLQVAASDAGSQVRNVEIWVSENNGPYSFNQSTNADQASFPGKPGYNYKFYSIAIDSVGNREGAPGLADAEVSVLVGTNEHFKISALRLYPMPAKDLLILEMSLAEASSLSVMLEDQAGRQIQSLFSGNLAAGWHSLPLRLEQKPGLYFVRIMNGAYGRREKLVVF